MNQALPMVYLVRHADTEQPAKVGRPHFEQSSRRHTRYGK
jgi:hypothetical protein